jgi:hypothetical protein
VNCRVAETNFKDFLAEGECISKVIMDRDFDFRQLTKSDSEYLGKEIGMQPHHIEGTGIVVRYNIPLLFPLIILHYSYSSISLPSASPSPFHLSLPP